MITLNIWTDARIRDPKARDPVWYRTARPNAKKSGYLGMSSGFLMAQ